MHPIITFLRLKGITAVLACSRLINRLTRGKHPKFLFSAAADIRDIQTRVKIVERTDTSVTVAKFRPDGTVDDGEFRVMTATDLHLTSPGEEKNNKTVKYFVRHIVEEKPDLVILTGDVILSDCQHIDAVQFSRMMEQLGVYWCYAFGNHEAREEKGYFKYLLYKGLARYPHCLNLFGDSSLFGYGNFAVNVLGGENRLLKSIFIFDSGRNIQAKVKKELGLPDGLNGYDFIKPSQIEWYLKEVNSLRQRFGEVKTVCCMHIPVPEYENVNTGDEENGYLPSGKAQILYGQQFESVGCSPYNSGLFDAGKKDGSLQAIFAGHDHINDFCAVYDGIFLVYTQCTGYNTYSLEDRLGLPEKDCPYGVTLTTFFPNGSLKIEPKKNADFISE